MEGHSSRLEQAEDRISELKDEMETKGKTEGLLVEQLKTTERNMEELTHSIKRHHLANWIKKEVPTICCLKGNHFIDRNKQWLRVKG
jgi:septal ring factor EnvC (AmiA/AmiB activator)